VEAEMNMKANITA